MKIVIIYLSKHHANTKRVALRMSHVTEAVLMSVSEAERMDLSEYDIIGFGSGIYHGNFHRKVVGLINRIELKGKKVFVFSTSGMGWNKYNLNIISILQERGAEVLGDFSCKGYDTYGVLRMIGGIAKRHPTESDFSSAESFMQRIVQDIG